MPEKPARNPQDLVVATTRISYELHDLAKGLAKLKGTSLSNLVRVALQEYVDNATTPEALDALQAEENARHAASMAAFEAFKTTLGKMTTTPPNF